jgi:hypothetical protein
MRHSWLSFVVQLRAWTFVLLEAFVAAKVGWDEFVEKRPGV